MSSSDLAAVRTAAAAFAHAIQNPDNLEVRHEAARLKEEADRQTTVIDGPGYRPVQPEELTWHHVIGTFGEQLLKLLKEKGIPASLPLAVQEAWEYLHQVLSDWSSERLLANRARILRALEEITKWKPRSRKKRRAGTPRLTPLTPQQTEAMQLYGEYKGKLSEAARVAGKTRQAMKKLGRNATPKPKTQRLPRDRRERDD